MNIREEDNMSAPVSIRCRVSPQQLEGFDWGMGGPPSTVDLSVFVDGPDYFSDPAMFPEGTMSNPEWQLNVDISDGDAVDSGFEGIRLWMRSYHETGSVSHRKSRSPVPSFLGKLVYNTGPLTSAESVISYLRDSRVIQPFREEGVLAPEKNRFIALDYLIGAYQSSR